MYQVQKPQVYHKNHLVGGDGLDYLSGIHFSHNDVSLYCWLFAKRTRRHVDKCWIHYGPAQKPTRVGIQILETLPRNLFLGETSLRCTALRSGEGCIHALTDGPSSLYVGPSISVHNYLYRIFRLLDA